MWKEPEYTEKTHARTEKTSKFDRGRPKLRFDPQDCKADVWPPPLSTVLQLCIAIS